MSVYKVLQPRTLLSSFCKRRLDLVLLCYLVVGFFFYGGFS